MLFTRLPGIRRHIIESSRGSSAMSTSHPFALERAVALSAVARACALTNKVFHNLVTSDTVIKKDKSPVTVGDFSAQAVVNTVLAAYFPDDPIVGEEDAADLRADGKDALRKQVVDLATEALTAPELEEINEGQNKWKVSDLSEEYLLSSIDRGNHKGGNKGRMWTLDPIDGTKGFLRGGQYAVCLALLIDGQVQLGVMGCPNLPVDASAAKPKEGETSSDRSDLGTLFIAIKGQGAWQRTLHPSAESAINMRNVALSQATFCESVEAGHSSQGTNARIAELLGITSAPVRMDSQAKYASISRGDGDVYLRLPTGDGSYQEKIWDHASGAVLVAEAGGIVSDIRGQPLDFSLGRTLQNNKGVVAAPKDVHAKVIEAVGQALHEEGRGTLGVL